MKKKYGIFKKIRNASHLFIFVKDFDLRYYAKDLIA